MNLALIALLGLPLNIDPLPSFYAALEVAYPRAVNTLLTCEYFREYYPAKAWMLEQLATYDPPSIEIFNFSDREACGYARANRNTIYLFKNAFDEPEACGTLESTLGHELLHIIRLPNHKIPTIPSMDEIYQITYKCFGRNYPY